MDVRWAAAALSMVVLVGACGTDGTTDEPAPGDGPPASPSGTTSRVLAISVDGMRSSSVQADATPHLAELFADGVGTLNARTPVEQTATMPSHVCMVTGRRIDGEQGHGVTWNEDTDQPVPEGVGSVFEVVAEGGGSTALVVGKSKLDILRDSWPDAVASFRLEADPDASAEAVLAELADRELVLWHLPGPDAAGHEDEWGSAAYDEAVRSVDEAVGTVLDAIAADPALAGEVAVVLTSDHGGVLDRHTHGDAPEPGNYTVPFVVRGPGIEPGDLHERSAGRTDPGGDRPSYDAGEGPVRTCDVANVVTDLLGLPEVPGSEFTGLRLIE